jgi:polyisoprenoid-binding protein YceI
MARSRRLVAGSLALGATLVCSSPTYADAARYTLDPEHLIVAFLVEHVGYAKVLGQFAEAEGSYVFDEATGELSDLRVVVDTASVSTNHRARDEHLRSPELLNSEAFPQMVFSAGGARRTGERVFEVEGELQLLGLAQPLTLTATWNKSSEYPFGDDRYVMGVSARGRFKRSAYGMTYAVANGWVGDEVEILIEFEAPRR